MVSMKTNSGPTKEEINAIEKGKGKDFRKQSSGKDRKGKKVEETPKKKNILEMKSASYVVAQTA